MHNPDYDLNGLTDSAMDSPEKVAKNERSERFKSILMRHKLPAHGAASIIASALGITPATVSAWVKGSLPRDPVILFKFCDAYDVDPYFWVMGTGRPRTGVDASRLIEADRVLASASTQLSTSLNERQKLVLLADIYNDRDRGLRRLEQLSIFLTDTAEP